MNKKRNKKGGASWTTYMLTYMPFLSPILAMSGHTGGGSSLNQSSVGGATSIVADHELSGPDAIGDDDDDVGADAELRGVEMV
eukprot:gene2690-1953_t